MADVVRIGRMTEAEYDRERARLREVYGDTRQAAGARFEQELAKLYHSTGWSQDKIAQKEGKSQSIINRWLRFGRFLEFMPARHNLTNLPNNLTEWRFRSYWARVPDTFGGNERQRFTAIARLMDEELGLVPPKPAQSVGAQIKEHFADGKWYPLSEIVAALPDYPEEKIKFALTHLGPNAKLEQRQQGRETAYRIFLKDAAVSVKEITEKLTPIIKELLVEGRKNMATMSPATVASLASRLRNLLDGWRG